MNKLSKPAEAARFAGLRYVTDASPGFSRAKSGSWYCYKRGDGKRIRDPSIISRIQKLVIPPAWTDVWICADPRGHLQATGRDDRGRKQFLYHPEWREVRDENKYNRLIQFAQLLPRIRRRVKRDLARPGLVRDKVLATVVRLLELSCIRIGNEEYALQNKSFGLTTFKDRHANVNGSKIQFRFRGKSGKEHELDLRDQRLARIVKACQELPGQELFQYRDATGEVRDIRSDDVNNYLREATRHNFTAKDFRTWSGTVLAAKALKKLDMPRTPSQLKRNISAAIKEVSLCLGNTAAVCRKCYVHPAIFHAYAYGTLCRTLSSAKKNKTAPDGLLADEKAVLRLLKARARRTKEPLERILKRSLAHLGRKSEKANKPLSRSKRQVSKKRNEDVLSKR